MDTNSLKKTIIGKLRPKIVGKTNYGNEEWGKASNDWYTGLHDSNHLVHEDFIKYVNAKKDVKTILEVGCGTGIYPIKNKKLFENKEYTGLDFSENNIKYCKNNSNFKFITGDFIKMEITEKFDLVYSHAVVDHVYDIDKFLTNLIQSSKKYAYIHSYRGYFPNLEKHKMNWNDNDACYYNDISIKRVKEILLEAGLKHNEFVIRGQKSGQNEKNLDTQLIIEIERED